MTSSTSTIPPLTTVFVPPDFSTDPPKSHIKTVALSATAKAGIGVGVTFGAFIIITLSMVILLARRKRSQRVQKYTATQPSNNKGVKIEVKKQPCFQNDCFFQSTSFSPSTWNAMGLDSWSFEAIAIYFSMACFVAIFCILQIYNRKETPRLFKGITLNTIVSVLATASKSSLIFVVGECIAQLRWISFQRSQQSLSHIQLYDSASRGPWGSLAILLKDKCRSLVTIGAIIVLLAMAFDPFVQQIMEYPILPTERPSKAARVTQSRYLLPSNMEWPFNRAPSLAQAINSGVWSGPKTYNVNCPTGNCTWPHFQSVELCTKCVDIDPSNITLSGWDDILSSNHFNATEYKGKNIIVDLHISVLNNTPWSLSNSITFKLEPVYVDNSSFFWDWNVNIPKNLFWIVETDRDEVFPEMRLGDLFGIDYQPLIVTASAELDLPLVWSTTQSGFTEAIKVAKANACATSICTREYAISVQHGARSVKVLSEDFGTLYVRDSPDPPELYAALCWKPSSSPTTNWNTTGDLEYRLYGVFEMDPTNFEFCGVESYGYYREIKAVLGITTLLYNATINETGVGLTFRNLTSQFPDSEPDVEFFNSGPSTARRAADIGLEEMMNNIASSVSAMARDLSNTSIYGNVTTQDSYVIVRWPWLTLPAFLLVAGILLLVATAVTSSRGGVRIWKSSTLPLMFHGLEPEFVSRSMMFEHGQCESVSEMEHVADGIKVDLGLSDQGGRTMLRGATPFPGSSVRRPFRRRSL